MYPILTSDRYIQMPTAKDIPGLKFHDKKLSAEL